MNLHSPPHAATFSYAARPRPRSLRPPRRPHIVRSGACHASCVDAIIVLTRSEAM